ncbi:hypothetical protein DL769_011278 [Monosporascus sp. CRB-8-3]|nr:hypothetical protein DL769_011278 [Monosporascus sp. CRB-8-3]
MPTVPQTPFGGLRHNNPALFNIMASSPPVSQHPSPIPSHPFGPPTSSPGISASRHAGTQGHAADRLSRLLKQFPDKQDRTMLICKIYAEALESAYASLPKEAQKEASKWKTGFLEYAEEVMLGIPAPLRSTTTTTTTTTADAGRTGSHAAAAAKGAAQIPQQTVYQLASQPPARTITNIRHPARGPQLAAPGPTGGVRGLGPSSRNKTLGRALAAEVGITTADIPEAHHTATGFSIRASTAQIQELLLEKGRIIGRLLHANKVETHVPWFNYVVPACPTTLLNLPSKAGRDAQGRLSWIVSFLAAVPPFRLWGVGPVSKLIKKHPPILRHSPGCQGYHAARACARNSRCENCGRPLGDKHPIPCQFPAQCANCFGPFPAEHAKCPARPERVDGILRRPTKGELSDIRRMGAAATKAKEADAEPLSPEAALGPAASSEAAGTPPVITVTPPSAQPQGTEAGLLAVPRAPAERRAERRALLKNKRQKRQRPFRTEDDLTDTGPESDYSQMDVEAEQMPDPMPEDDDMADDDYSDEEEGLVGLPKYNPPTDGQAPALTAAQCNLGKGWPSASAFPQLCWGQQIDVVMVQEPPVSRDGKRIISMHPSYEPFLPVDSWDSEKTRPRVITYVLKADGLRPTASRPVGHTRDILWVEVAGITFVNFYRPPNKRREPALDLLMGWQPPKRCLVAGDFNARSPVWDPERGHRNRGKELAKWADSHGLLYAGQPGKPTHDDGGVLDLTFSNHPFASARQWTATGCSWQTRT